MYPITRVRSVHLLVAVQPSKSISNLISAQLSEVLADSDHTHAHVLLGQLGLLCACSKSLKAVFDQVG